MKNAPLNSEAQNIIKTPNVSITKGTVGGCSIEVNVQEPVFEDIGSYLYKTEVERDADFDELLKMKANAKN
jgi:hypothetical protein